MIYFYGRTNLISARWARRLSFTEDVTAVSQPITGHVQMVDDGNDLEPFRWLSKPRSGEG